MPERRVSLPTTNGKPALSSLKPEKKGSTAAKKRAVKRIDAAAAKKTPLKKSKNEAIKKVAIRSNKHAAPTHATLEKTLLTPRPEKTRVTSKKPASLAVKKSSTGTKTKSKSKTAHASQIPDWSVKLPTNMSIRAREKTLALLHMVNEDFRVPMQKVAYVSSFAFIALGSLVALSYSYIATGAALQSASLASTTGDITSFTSETKTDTVTLATAVTTITTTQTLPSLLTSDTEFTFAATNAKNVVARLYGNDGDVISLNVSEVHDDTYRALLRVSQLEPGEYYLKLSAESLSTGQKANYTAGTFIVPSEEKTNTTTGIESTTDTIVETTNETTTEIKTASTTDTSLLETLEKQEVRLVIDGGDFVKREVVRIEAPEMTSAIEVYVRPLRSVQPLFLGAALEGTSSWYYFFDTLHVPNGEYELFAYARVGKERLASPAKKIRIANFSTQPTSTTTLTTSIEPVSATNERVKSEPAETETVTPETTTQYTRSFSDATLDTLEAESANNPVAVAPDTAVMVKELLRSYEDELTDLLKRYAVAQQSTDPLIIEIAKTAFVESKKKFIERILLDQDISFLADDVDAVLITRFEELQKRVETFEQLRRTANTEVSTTDTDQDGISDFDEKNLYRTNPEQADTDNDGILDGVEIMRGFDPLNASAEAVIEYEMPQESLALVREEVLVVEQVVPITQTDSEGTVLPTFAEIRGKALPNSYVTVYIFSTPTIVTVRTDSDGSFVYTFEKELEDGEHEVYVAVTDNTGAIMARSNPFRFVKEAQAFTPLSTASGEMVPADAATAAALVSPYNIAVGLGILAFGLILLMLGISLREKDQVVMTKPTHDLKTS